MKEIISNPFFVAAISIVLSIALTFLVRKYARKYDFVAKPKLDRWHKKPTALMGGISIYLTTVIIYLAFIPKTPQSWIILAGSTFLFFVGLVDDLLFIKPYQKLIGQFIGVGIILGVPSIIGINPLVLPWTSSEIFNIWMTGFWLIGITNAINLLDNMDGLAGGISAIAAFILAIGLGANGQPFELLFICAFVGALVGFLVYNFNPATIFMGDAGSMFVGFFLASSVLLNQTGGRSRSIVGVLAVPALILFVPIFDTTFVTILRKLSGRKASQGGRDHTSHRLVALGLSERSAVLMLYGFAILAGIISLFVRDLHSTQSLAVIALFTLLLTIIGVYLAKVKVYEEQEEELAIQNNTMFSFLLNLSHKRRIFEVVLDSVLISLSYYFSYVLLFGAFENIPDAWTLFVNTLPILLITKLGAFLIVGVYRGIWRYTSIQDLVTFGKAVILGSILSVLTVLLFYRFQGFSRAVFVLDGVLLLVALAGSRMAFRLFRQLIPRPMGDNRRNVLIYGAGDGGEMVLRELKNNPEWEYEAIGFIDDDPLKKGKVINGLKVYGGNGSLLSLCKKKDVQEILLSFRQISPEKLKEMRVTCENADVSLKRALIKIEPVEFE